MNNYLRTIFKLLVYSAIGNQFENLFSAVQCFLHKDFQPVKPHGSLGDRGNDGFLPHSGTYFQVYAPEELKKNTNVAQKKVKADFGKLKRYWNPFSPIKKFYFVLNDKFEGVSPHIHKTLKQIQDAESLEDAGVYHTRCLERDLFSLRFDQICSILGVNILDINIIVPQAQDDINKVRDFLKFYDMAFYHLFSNSDIAYFFPIIVYNKYYNLFDNDWKTRYLISDKPDIAEHQNVIISAIHDIFQQIQDDSEYYTYIGKSLKLKIPFSLPDNMQITEDRVIRMQRLIIPMIRSYLYIKQYAYGSV